MKNKLSTIIYILVTISLIVLIGIFGFNLYNKKNLDKEIKKMTNKDVTNYKYTEGTKTYFSYSKVESAVKEYMRDYSNNINKVDEIINDEEIKKILSVENYNSDGKDFNKSTELLNNKLLELEETINNLYELNTKEKIKEYIEKKEVSSRYEEIYNQYMFNEGDLNNNKNVIDNLKQNAENILNTDLKVIELLKNNKDSWIISDNKIAFYNNDIMNQYNTLINSIN